MYMKDLEMLCANYKFGGKFITTLYPIEDVRGMSGQSIRQLLNGLVAGAKVYLECGLYCGLSFTSAMQHNTFLTRAIAIDSWAEFTQGGRIKPREEFLAAVAKYYPKNVPLTLLEQDHWSVTELPAKPDLFYYDGAHDERSQERALTHYGPLCAEEFIFCCDDWNWEKVRRGTLRGLDHFTILDQWEKRVPSDNDKEWWNGFYVALLRQK
jgi:hypothetical protein